MGAISRIDKVYTDNSPYRKFDRLGARSLTDAELLAIILRSGTHDQDAVHTAEILLGMCSGSLVDLLNLSMKDLMSIDGIGPVRARVLKAVFELSYRIASGKRRSLIRMEDSNSIAGYYMERLRHEDRELLIAAFFNVRQELIHERVVTIGSYDETLFPIGLIYREALECGASSVVMLHNHPSGDPSPSSADIQATHDAREAGILLDIVLFDHIIIGDNRYFSFRDGGLI